MNSNVDDSEQLVLPLLPLRDVVVFPHMVIPLFVGRQKSIKALELAMESNKSILLVAQKIASKDEPAPHDMYAVCSIANILQMLKLPDGTVKVLVEGSERAHILDFIDSGTHFDGKAVQIAEEKSESPETEAMRRALMTQFDQYVKLNKKFRLRSLLLLAVLMSRSFGRYDCSLSSAQT